VWGNLYAPMLIGRVRHLPVGPGWHATLGAAVLHGRVPAPGDGPAVLVNRAFAVRLLPGADPVGQEVLLGPGWSEPYRVVGVVEDLRARGPGTPGAAPPTVYLPFALHPAREVGIAARALRDGEALLEPVAAALVAAVPGARVLSAGTLETALRRHAAPLRWFAAVLAALALAAVAAAAGGVYGVMAFGVARRTRELGVRAALGATPGRLLREVLGEGARLAAAGAAAGSVGAWTVARLLQERFHGVDPFDPAAYLGVAAVLAAITLAGSALPALRASRVEAAVALRAE
jgi:putative ABC transport system permease protein